MDQLLCSRINKQEETRLQNLSPDKFGRSAYAKLSYTPSKLANNVLYKEVTQMKKTQENGSKVREFQSLNQILKDKIRNLQAQKTGIEQSLTQQINMYKKMVLEMEEGLEKRVKELQVSFTSEMKRIIDDKEQEAKYIQAQKEMMENRIFELENYIAELKEEINNRNNLIDKNNQQYEKLQIRFKNSEGTVKQLKSKMQQSEAKAMQEIKELKDKLETQASSYQDKLEKLELIKNREKQQLQVQLRGELQKLQKQKNHQLMLKNQELKDVTASFEAQAKQSNENIAKKDQYIQTLTKNLNDEKQKLLKITKQYTVQVANLNNEKKMIEQQCQTVTKNFEKQKQENKRLKTSSNQTQAYYQQEIQKLKKQLELTHLDLLKQRQRFYLEKDDLKHEVLILRKNVEQNSRLVEQNNYLCKEIKNLKEILTESAMEMERCKDQFVRLGAEKDSLVVKLKQLDMENETLHRINIQREEQARTWRESYYKYRR